jgi:S-adenosylmethionine:tRNA ribosyltransferase-isomerase
MSQQSDKSHNLKFFGWGSGILMKLSDFDYQLPEDLIAQYPTSVRSQSRLLVMQRSSGELEHARFSDIVDYLQPGDRLVLNNTRVIPARLTDFQIKDSGKINGAEILLLKEIEPNLWECLVKPGKKLTPGARIIFDAADLEAEIVSTTQFGGRTIKFLTQNPITPILDQIGHPPLPPYIKRAPEKELDPERYQTVYARKNGSAAAPTAGLHFTDELLQQIRNKGIETHAITLHVGLDTFRPVRAENILEHQMHSEYYSIDGTTAAALTTAKKEKRRIIAVGTTTVRALESASDEKEKISASAAATRLFIYPGYQFKCVDAIVTNFHLPKSTLLMMVSAFTGREKILKAYHEAIAHKYRFFSYGDAMFIQ